MEAFLGRYGGKGRVVSLSIAKVLALRISELRREGFQDDSAFVCIASSGFEICGTALLITVDLPYYAQLSTAEHTLPERVGLSSMDTGTGVKERLGLRI